jgi:hypothetical protein
MKKVPSFSTAGGLLVMLFMFTLVPFHAFHHHEEDSVCHDSHHEEPLNLCHLALHHLHSDITCEHDKHFDRAVDECSYCRLLPIKVNHFSFTGDLDFVIHKISSAYNNFVYFSSSSGFTAISGNKGPPVAVSFF